MTWLSDTKVVRGLNKPLSMAYENAAGAKACSSVTEKLTTWSGVVMATSTPKWRLTSMTPHLPHPRIDQFLLYAHTILHTSLTWIYKYLTQLFRFFFFSLRRLFGVGVMLIHLFNSLLSIYHVPGSFFFLSARNRTVDKINTNLLTFWSLHFSACLCGRLMKT